MKKILLTLLIFTSTFMAAYAQLPPGGGDAPIDGGVAGLLAAGAAYGIYKMKRKEKKKEV